MNELEIIKCLARSIDDRDYPFQLPNAFVYNWESDYWVLTSKGDTKEFEIKISRSDFIKDAKKEKHAGWNNIGPNYFYYVCPVGVIHKGDIDKNYGLIYVHTTGRVEIIKKPRRLNERKFDQWQMLAVKMYWKWYALWKEKYISKAISYPEYREGFTIQLNEVLELDKPNQLIK